MYKKILKWSAKIGLTVLAFYLLSKQINWSEVRDVIKNSSLWLILIALILYVLSKVCSAYRLNFLFRNMSIELSEVDNIKLYFIGMFYNLFLPGGIGGDGYKAYWIKKNYKSPTKQVISALFLDRFYGLSALFSLFFIGLFFTNLFAFTPDYVFLLVIILLILVLPAAYLIVAVFFESFKPTFFKAIAWSFVVQLIQILEAFIILKAIGIHRDYINYIVLFLASSIASVLPISIGGVGLRELTFVYGNEILSISNNEAVAFTLIFFVLTLISSFSGVFFSMKKKK